MKKSLIFLGLLLLPMFFTTGCSTENGVESTDNLTVYKTIDFASYTGDTNSVEFDDLVGKKVIFTNVPTLGGTLGNLSKGFICRNESSLIIEDDVKYTLTGVVSSTIGTYSVSLKDCTLEKK